MSLLIADIETDGLLPDLTRIWCLGVSEGGERTLYADQEGCNPLSEGFARLRRAKKVVFHNGLEFDYWAINRFSPGTLRFEQIVDTLVMSRLLNPEERAHSLGAWGERLNYPKVEHEDWSQWSPEMAHRCLEDVGLSTRLYEHLSAKLVGWGESVDLEHQVAFIMAVQKHHGFRLDLEKACVLAAELAQERADIQQSLRERWEAQWEPERADWDFKNRRWSNVRVTDPGDVPFLNKDGSVTKRPYVAPYTKVTLKPFEPTSRPQIAQRLSAQYGWKPRRFTPTGSAQIDDAVLADLKYEEAQALARTFRLTKLLGMISEGDNAWLKLEKDGYVHGSVNPNGAVTGRMSHFSPNMAQVDKKEPRMREVWLPDEGDVLLGADAEGLELRMLAHYLARYDNGAYSVVVVEGKKEDGSDVHSRTMKLVGLYSRDNAKRVIYAMIYGAGDTKLGLIITEDAHMAGKSLGGRPSNLGREARAALETGIVGLKDLNRTVKRRVKTPGYITGLDGRHIRIRSEHSALNTLLQGAGAVVMKKALAIFWFERAVAAGYIDRETYLPVPNTFKPCANVHDEVQFSVRPDLAPLIGEMFAGSITEAGTRLGVRCPLSGSYDVGANWKETH